MNLMKKVSIYKKKELLYKSGYRNFCQVNWLLTINHLKVNGYLSSVVTLQIWALLIVIRILT